jgi:hypothetical protein
MNNAAGRPMPGARARRERRAAAARHLLAQAPEAAAELDWAALDSAPDWLSWPEPEVARLQCRVGALLAASQIRLWIDAPRLGAAASALGRGYLRAVLALPRAQLLPRDVAASPSIASADQVAPLLRAAGSAVLFASLPFGPLRHSITAAMAPVTPLPMVGALAESLVAQARHLAARTEESTERTPEPEELAA